VSARYWIALGAMLATLLAVGVVLDRKLDAWQVRAETALTFASAQEQRADSAERYARDQELRADSLADVASRKADTVRLRIPEIREVPVPDTCRPFVAVRDTMIDIALAAADEQRRAYEAEVLAAAGFRTAVAELRVANDTLSAVLAARPKAPPWYLPSIGVGPYIGVDSRHRLSKGVALTLSWKVL